MNSARLRSRGFTLLEVLIAVAIFAVVTALSFTVFVSLSGSSRSQRQEAMGRQAVNNALDLLTREIGLVGFNRNKDDIDAAEVRRFAFWADLNNDSVISLDNNPGNDQPRVEKITFACDLNAGTLTRGEDQGSTIQVIDDVTNCQFEYFDADGAKLDEDGNAANGQQITLQKTRDQIRRLRVTIDTRPAGESGQAEDMVVTRDISLPNMAVEELEECGRIAVDAYMTVKACNPPGERGEIVVTTYDKNGDRTDSNDVLFSVSPSGSAFQTEAGAALSGNALRGLIRDSRETVYFVPDSTEAGKEYAVSAEWTPPEAGCWKRVATAMMKVVPGDACGIQFVEAPDRMIVCQPDGYDPGVNVVVAVTDSCENFVPDQIIQVEIVGNDAQGSLGTIEGSPARPEIRSDQYGKAYFKYRPPDTVWPDHVTIKATIAGDVGVSCNPEVTHVFELVANTAYEISKVSPAEPILACPDQTLDMAVRVRDACGNDVYGLTNLTAEVYPPDSVHGEYVTDLQNHATGGVATLSEVDSSGHTTRGTYWYRLHTGHGFFTSLPIRITQPSLSSGTTLTYATSLACNGCTFTVESTPENAYGSGLPLNGAIGDTALLRFHGYPLVSRYVKLEITGGQGSLYRDPYGLIPFTSGTLLPLDDQGYGSIYLHNSTSAPTQIGSSISVRGRDYFTETAQGGCDKSTSVPVVCSAATAAITNESGQPVTAANPWDPTLSTAKMRVSVSDKNLPGAPNSTKVITAVTDTGDDENITLTNGASGGWVYTNGTGMGFADLATGSNPTDRNGTLQPDLVGTVWVTYADTTVGCPAPAEQITLSAPVDGCTNVFSQNFEDSPSDSGTWTTSYKDFTGNGHPEWNYQDWARGNIVYYGAGTPTSCPSGKCYGTNLDGNYGADGPGNPQKTYLGYLTRTTTFNTTGLTQAFIFFDLWLDMGSGATNNSGACAFVEQKIGTGSWSMVAFSSYNDKADSLTGYNNSACWGGDVTGGQWQRVSKSLTGLLNKTGVQLRWSFFTKTSDYLPREGMYLDNVRVCGSTRGS